MIAVLQCGFQLLQFTCLFYNLLIYSLWHRFAKYISDPGQLGAVGGHLVPCSWGCPQAGTDDKHTGYVVCGMFVVLCVMCGVVRVMCDVCCVVWCMVFGVSGVWCAVFSAWCVAWCVCCIGCASWCVVV